jgi:Carboxypeptidase regulatory-like domain
MALMFCVLTLGAIGSAQQPAPSPGQPPPAQPTPSPTPAVQPPLAPAPQSPAQASEVPGAIVGIVTDADSASIPSARITLTPGTQPAPPSPTDTPTTALTADDGSFTLTGIPPSSFTLTIAATGFTTRQISGDLHSAETLDLPAIVLTAAANTDVQVVATQIEIAQAQIGEEEKQRVLGAIPNFYVSYVSDPVPLTPDQKFQLAYRTLIDPVSLILNGIAAGAQQATDTYAWGEGAEGYTKRYAAAYGSFLTGDMLGNAAFPILFKQDPRYFYKGAGTIRHRVLYAIANAVICKGDNMRWQPNYSAILGGLASGAISNLYYPAPNRSGAALTFEGAALGTAITAVSNLLQEFVIPHLTPHIPPKASPTP